MQRYLKRLMLGPVLGLAALLTLGGSPARADILVNLVSALPSGANTVYTYNVFLQPNSALTTGGGLNSPPPGDFFTLYDIAGLVGTPTQNLTNSLSWTVTTPLQGKSPAVGGGAPDSISILNATFQYSGSPIINNGGTGSALSLGTISFTSTFGTGGKVFYSAATQDSDNNNVEANNTNSVEGPTGIPEPGSLAMTACLVAGFGGALLRRRRRSQA